MKGVKASLILRKEAMATIRLVVISVTFVGLTHLIGIECLCKQCVCKKEYDNEWARFRTKYRRNFPNCFEECKRRALFEKKCEFLKKYKSSSTKTHQTGGRSFTIAYNKFMDMTDVEIYRMMGFYNNYYMGFDDATILEDSNENDDDDDPPRLGATPVAYLNYAELGYVSEVKDQKSCGSCWAITSGGAMAAQIFGETGLRPDISPQHFMDCCTNAALYGCYGCQGGWMNGAFKCAKDIGGVTSSYVYEYKAKQGNCSRPTSGPLYVCYGYQKVLSNDENQMKLALDNVGPLACAMDATQQSFLFYDSGIYYDDRCSQSVNHAVLVVGYGTSSDGLNYWIVMNSWGTSWGEQGYCRILRGKNVCGISRYCSYPTNCTVLP